MTRRSRLVLAGACAAYVVLAAAAGVYLAEGVLRPPRRAVTAEAKAAAVRVADRDAARLETIAIETADHTRLRAWLFTPAAGHADSVIVLHGQASNRAGMLSYIDMLLSAGFQVLAPDARGQGDSAGDIVSYGVVESSDVRAWVNLLRERNGGRSVHGFAESMGAGTLLQAIGADQAFCSVVVESPFASFREAAYDRVASAFHAGPWLGRTVMRPVIDAGFSYARLRYGVDLDRADPRPALSASRVPVLLIHGTADTSIPPRHSRLLLESRPRGTTLWEVPGAEHCGALGVAPEEFRRRVLDALHRHSSPPDVK